MAAVCSLCRIGSFIFGAAAVPCSFGGAAKTWQKKKQTPVAGICLYFDNCCLQVTGQLFFLPGSTQSRSLRALPNGSPPSGIPHIGISILRAAAFASRSAAVSVLLLFFRQVQQTGWSYNSKKLYIAEILEKVTGCRGVRST